MKSILVFLILFPCLAFGEALVKFRGEITPRSLDSLERKILKKVSQMKPGDDRVIVTELSSGGGNLLATLTFVQKIRRISRQMNFTFHTSVRFNCESSCTVLFTAGEERRAGRWAQFGFHSPKVESKLPAGVTKLEVLTQARSRWLAAVEALDPRLADEIDRRRLLFDDKMTYFQGRDLMTGYVTNFR